MKTLITEIIHELDYHNEFTTKEAIIYTILAIAIFAIALCGESIILGMF